MVTKAETTIERVGGYRVVRRLATGGTSDVLLAKAEGPLGFERTVVLKLLLSQFRGDDEFARMFAREASAYARLSHPSIVRLFDFFAIPAGSTDPKSTPGREGQLCMVLEHVDGPPLTRFRSMLKAVGKELEDRAAIHVAACIFDALAAAHAALDAEGVSAPVIHRDVNPSNVLVQWDGKVKLADFGVAKVTGLSHQSVAGMIKGTYGYMAPEQVTGDPVTPRADVYAGAIILWELLTKRRAFQRGALPEVEALRAMAEPRLVALDTIRPDVDKAVRDAMKRALEPRAEKRKITAEEMVSILRGAVSADDGRERLANALALVKNDPRAAKVLTDPTASGAHSPASIPTAPMTVPDPKTVPAAVAPPPTVQGHAPPPGPGVLTKTAALPRPLGPPRPAGPPPASIPRDTAAYTPPEVPKPVSRAIPATTLQSVPEAARSQALSSVAEATTPAKIAATERTGPPPPVTIGPIKTAIGLAPVGGPSKVPPTKTPQPPAVKPVVPASANATLESAGNDKAKESVTLGDTVPDAPPLRPATSSSGPPATVRHGSATVSSTPLEQIASGVGIKEAIDEVLRGHPSGGSSNKPNEGPPSETAILLAPPARGIGEIPAAPGALAPGSRTEESSADLGAAIAEVMSKAEAPTVAPPALDIEPVSTGLPKLSDADVPQLTTQILAVDSLRPNNQEEMPKLFSPAPAPAPSPELPLDVAPVAEARPPTVPPRRSSLESGAHIPYKKSGSSVGTIAVVLFVLVAAGIGGAVAYGRYQGMRAEAPPAPPPPVTTTASSAPTVSATASGAPDPGAALSATASAVPLASVSASAAASPDASVAVRDAGASAATATPVAAGEGMGLVKTTSAAPGRRIFVDEKVLGQTPETVSVKCGQHSVRLGSTGKAQPIEVPCGGEVDVADKF